MSTVITSVDHRSPAQRAGIRPGEKLLTINGHEIVDVLDYRFYGYDAKCRLELLEPNGSVRNVQIKKEEGLDLGLNFDTYLMDEMRCCANHCVFCFVDQMPPGMRQTLYFKDDDARLSFLQGNYITLTNLTEREAQRIIDRANTDRQDVIDAIRKLQDDREDAREEYADLLKERDKVLADMDKLRAAGRNRGTTYQQLLAQKLTVQNLIGRFEIYGIKEA